MTFFAAQQGTIRSIDQLTLQPATASLKTSVLTAKISVTARQGTITSAQVNAIPGRVKTGAKVGTKASEAYSEGAEKVVAPATPAMFQDLMAWLLPQQMNTQTVASGDGVETLAAASVQGKKPASAVRKTATATVVKAAGDGGATKLVEDAKAALAVMPATRAAAGVAAVSSAVLAPAPLSGPAHFSASAVLNDAISGSRVLAMSDAKADHAEIGSFSAVDVHGPRGDLHVEGEAKVFAATPGVLEVGIPSGTHGWLRVRAEVGNEGEINASLVTRSAGAAEELHKELPSISAFLTSEQVGISTVVVHAAERGAGAHASAMSFGGGGSGQQNQREQRAAQFSGTELDPLISRSDFPLLRAGDGWSGFAFPAALYANREGGWLSIRV